MKHPLRIRELTVKEIEKYDCGSIPQPALPRAETGPEDSRSDARGVDDLGRTEGAQRSGLNIEAKMDEAEALLPNAEFFAQRVLEAVAQI